MQTIITDPDAWQALLDEHQALVGRWPSDPTIPPERTYWCTVPTSYWCFPQGKIIPCGNHAGLHILLGPEEPSTDVLDRFERPMLAAFRPPTTQ